MTLFFIIDLYDVASGGKQTPAAAFKPKGAPPVTLDYTDIPHSQIRKVVYDMVIVNTYHTSILDIMFFFLLMMLTSCESISSCVLVNLFMI